MSLRVLVMSVAGVLAISILSDVSRADSEPEAVQIAKRKIEEQKDLILRTCYPSASFTDATYTKWRTAGAKWRVSYRFTYKALNVPRFWLPRTAESRDIGFDVDPDGSIFDVVDEGGREKIPIFTLVRLAKFGIKGAITAIVRYKWLSSALNALPEILGVSTEPGQMLARVVNHLSPTPSETPPPGGPDAGAPPHIDGGESAPPDPQLGTGGGVGPDPSSGSGGASGQIEPPGSGGTIGRDDGQGRSGRYCYSGAHPGSDRRWESTDVPHMHDYPPFDGRLFVVVNDCYAFIGDPYDFGYTGPGYGYYGSHPLPSNLGAGWCLMVGPHRHTWQPWSSSFKELGPFVFWDGPRDQYAEAYQPYYAAYFDNYYPQYYADGRYYETGRIAPVIVTVPFPVWRGQLIRSSWNVSASAVAAPNRFAPRRLERIEVGEQRWSQPVRAQPTRQFAPNGAPEWRGPSGAIGPRGAPPVNTQHFGPGTQPWPAHQSATNPGPPTGRVAAPPGAWPQANPPAPSLSAPSARSIPYDRPAFAPAPTFHQPPTPNQAQYRPSPLASPGAQYRSTPASNSILQPNSTPQYRPAPPANPAQQFRPASGPNSTPFSRPFTQPTTPARPWPVQPSPAPGGSQWGTRPPVAAPAPAFRQPPTMQRPVQMYRPQSAAMPPPARAATPVPAPRAAPIRQQPTRQPPPAQR